MQIMLMEDDGIFFGGVPQNVILQVKFDDGKIKRLPYSAEKSISALYQDLHAIANKITQSDVIDHDVPEEGLLLKAKAPIAVKKIEDTAVEVMADRANIIEKEDFVTLIRLDAGRNKDATCDLVVGHEYRVISVIQTGVTLPGEHNITRIVQGYDVVNDKGDRPERTRVFPHEVTLKSKRTSPIIKKELVVSEILDCPICTTPNALALDGTTFKGVCSQCRADLAIERVIRKCLTEKCANDVSCFDVGGAYKGQCNKCLANLEVPYG